MDTRPSPGDAWISVSLKRGRWVWLVRVLLALSVSGLAGALASQAPVALALFIRSVTVNSNTFSTMSIGAPSSISATVIGHNVDLTWPAASGADGYLLERAASSSGTCTGLSYSTLTQTVTLVYTDTSYFTPQGAYGCYRLSKVRFGWTSQSGNPTVAARLGFFASSLTMVNAGNTSNCTLQQTGGANSLDCGDQIVIGFNQAVSTTTTAQTTETVCTNRATGTIWLASATLAGNCAVSEGVSVGKLTGSTITACDCRFTASYAWSVDSTVLTITIGLLTTGITYPTLGGTAWTMTPTTNTVKLLSNVGSFHICDSNSGGANCLPSTP
jgi:hypothetical protein